MKRFYILFRIYPQIRFNLEHTCKERDKIYFNLKRTESCAAPIVWERRGTKNPAATCAAAGEYQGFVPPRWRHRVVRLMPSCRAAAVWFPPLASRA